MGRPRKSETVEARPVPKFAPVMASELHERHGRARDAYPDRQAELIRTISAYNERPLRTIFNLVDGD